MVVHERRVIRDISDERGWSRRGRGSGPRSSQAEHQGLSAGRDSSASFSLGLPTYIDGIVSGASSLFNLHFFLLHSRSLPPCLPPALRPGPLGVVRGIHF